MELRDAAQGPPLDAVVIGGGINGCGIARELALRGLRVALFEKDDFGAGTTWRSTKLIHGGLRYLEHGELRLVFESLRERAWLLRTRPHLVHRQRLLFPMLPWSRRPAWQVRAGLIAYDLMATGGRLPRHRWLKRDSMQRLTPFLDEGHDGGFAFYDARARSPERLTLELACEARDAGALVLNHARVTDILRTGGRTSGVRVEWGGTQVDVPSGVVINAAGPWVDAVNRAAGINAPELLGVTRGTHLVLECDYAVRDALFSTARSDGRVFFAVPQDKLLLVGTTDLRFDDEPDSVRPTREEADYLLEEARILMPGLDIRREQVRYCYAGLRPLQKSTGEAEAAITRQHRVVAHGESRGPQGLYSVIGGKLSSFRPLARELAAILGADLTVDDTADETPLDWRSALRSAPFDLQTKLRLRSYGPALSTILSEPADTISDSPVVLHSEIERTVKHELATTLEDFMLRRSGLGWNRERGLDCHRPVADAMGPLLGWSEEERSRQVTWYEDAVRFHLPGIEDLEGG
jgi:glycerol-3-phosphate dehydrogenase